MISVDDIVYLKSSAQAGRSNAVRLVDGLAECALTGFFSDAGVAIKKYEEGDVLAGVSTPTSQGRLTLTWHGKPSELESIVRVQRRSEDDKGNTCWETVLSIYPHRYGDLKFVTPNSGQVEPRIEGVHHQDSHWVALTLVTYYLSNFDAPNEI